MLCSDGILLPENELNAGWNISIKIKLRNNDRRTKIIGSAKNVNANFFVVAPDIFLIPASLIRLESKVLIKLIKFITAINKMKIPAIANIYTY